MELGSYINVEVALFKAQDKYFDKYSLEKCFFSDLVFIVLFSDPSVVIVKDLLLKKFMHVFVSATLS